MDSMRDIDMGYEATKWCTCDSRGRSGTSWREPASNGAANSEADFFFANATVAQELKHSSCNLCRVALEHVWVADEPGRSAPVGKRSQLWDCVAARKCGLKSYFPREKRVEHVDVPGRRRGQVRLFLVAGLIQPRERRRTSVFHQNLLEDGPAQTARTDREHQSAQVAKLNSAHQRQHKEAVDACMTLASTAEKIKEA